MKLMRDTYMRYESLIRERERETMDRQIYTEREREKREERNTACRYADVVGRERRKTHRHTG